MSDDGPPAKKAKKAKKADTKSEEDDLPICPYGEKCYRKNPQHFKEYAHPKDGEKVEARRREVDTDKLPPCPFGASCYRKNLLHFAEFSHPTSGASTSKDDSGSDTDVYNSDAEDDKKKKTTKTKIEPKDGKLDRLPTLVKSYSKMTENERKDLIKRAMEAKKKLEKELEKTKKQVEEKDKELNKLQEQVNTGLLLMDGEKEALDGDETKYFDLIAERAYKEGSAAQVHFRLAESQFYRLLSGYGSAYRITKVEYVVNPKLHKCFKEARDDIKKERGETLSYPVLAFHGTKEENISKICESNFKVPGGKGFKHRTDTGWYGKGVYFSEYPAYSMGYIQGGQKLLLCQVLPGKVFQCTKLIHGQPLKSGHDSHTSPDKKELVIFNNHHILPSYIVHYKQGVGEFKYKKAPEEVKKLLAPDIKKLADKAEKVKATNCLSGHTYALAGKFVCGTGTMMELISNHGGYIAGGQNTFNVLVCTEEEFKKKSAKVKKAKTYNSQIVREEFVLESIIQKVRQDFEDYGFE